MYPDIRPVSMEVANPRFWPGDRSSVSLSLLLLSHTFHSYLCSYFPSRPVICYPQFAFYLWRVRDPSFLLFQKRALFKTAGCLLSKICENAISVSYDGFTGLSNDNRKHLLCFWILREQKLES